MISLLIAKEIGFKYIYLIGCDGHKFDVHFYDKFTGDHQLIHKVTLLKIVITEEYIKGCLKEKTN